MNEKDYKYKHISNIDKKGNRTDVTDVEFANEDLLKVTGADNKTKKRVNVSEGSYKVNNTKNKEKRNY